MRKSAVRKLKRAFHAALGREVGGAPVYETQGLQRYQVGAVQELRRLKRDYRRGKLKGTLRQLARVMRQAVLGHVGENR